MRGLVRWRITFWVFSGISILLGRIKKNLEERGKKGESITCHSYIFDY